jgi:hypothetical protein
VDERRWSWRLADGRGRGGGTTEICDGRGRSWRWCGRDLRRARSEAGATEKAAAEAGGGELFPSRVHGDGRGARPAACVEEEAVAGEEGVVREMVDDGGRSSRGGSGGRRLVGR